MNALPVGPHQMADRDIFEQYFDDVERWSFDVAYTAYYAFPHDEVVGPLKAIYVAFAEEARRRGIPACVQIQSTISRGDRISISEAQYHRDNTPDRWAEEGFFASFASEQWKGYLKELTTFFIKECGFDWVVYEEPMYRVDIPGTEDRFYAAFKVRYPDLPYPAAREETPSYLAVQKLKADLLVEFYDDLTAHAKSVGAEKVGIMPWFFIPTVENTPAGTLNTSCDTGRINSLEHLDFLVVRMQPDNIFAGVMRTGDDMERSPLLNYVEVLAHALGKPVMAVNNPTDEHTDYPKCPLIPLEFFKKATLASLAAAPHGMTRHWYLQNYGSDGEHVEFLGRTNAVINRLGGPLSPVAFVFSYSGTRHAEPATSEQVWRSYWALARKMLFDERRPMLTFYADTLVEDLERHPEVQVLILEEHFPLTSAQVNALRRWWQGRPNRGIVVFSANSGYSADIMTPGVATAAEAFPGLIAALGIRSDNSKAPASEGEVSLDYVGGVKRSRFLGEVASVPAGSAARLGRVLGPGRKVLYVDATGAPVVLESREQGSIAIFCGIALSEATAELAAKTVNYALESTVPGSPAVASNSRDVLWNETVNGYLIISNCSDHVGTVSLHLENSLLWDVQEHMLLAEVPDKLDLEPLSFRLFRRLSRRTKLLDVVGAIWISRIIDGAGRADISIMAGRRTAFWVKSPPRDIYVDGSPSQITLVRKNAACLIELQDCPPGARNITLKW